MKIVSINTFSHTGGASIAALRILDALNAKGDEAKLLTYYKDKEHENIIPYTESFIGEKVRFLRFVYERLRFLPLEKSKEVRFQFSIANTGVDLVNHPLVREADVIHLHWFNKSFLSLKGLENILKLGKPVVWTLHDMWAFTGGCHYNYEGCLSFQSKCQACPMIKNSNGNDLSTKIWEQKEQLYKYDNLHWVTCSQWLAGVLKSSSLLKSHQVTPIPNPIDSSVFKPLDKDAVRKKLGIATNKKQILFVAMNTSDKRKGFSFLEEALHDLDADNYELLIIGKASPELLEQLPLKTNYMGFVKSQEKIIDIYNAADVYVSPTLQDNLPNTVMEALACGTPVVAFETGGVPEMVRDRIEGRIVEQGNANELAKAINWVLEDDDRYQTLAENARKKVIDHFSYDKVARKYSDYFKLLLS